MGCAQRLEDAWTWYAHRHNARTWTQVGELLTLPATGTTQSWRNPG